MRSMGPEGEGNYNYMADKLYEAARSTEGTSMKTFVAEDNDDGLFFHRLTPGDQSNALHVAAQHGNHDFISALLHARSSINPYELVCKHNSKGETPLHLAAQSGCKKTVLALLHVHDHNKSLLACWRERDNQGDTPLHIALRYGHDEIAVLILERDLELASIYNNVGESLAYLAAENFCPNLLQKILDADRRGLCPVSFSGPFGQTAFHPASKLNEDIMSILIERRKHLLKVQDNKGKTVLHYAVEEHNESMVETLLKADSYLAYFHDKDGFTPLHIAASRGFLPIIQTILELSPQSIVVRDKHHGKTALHVAKMDAVFLRGCLKKTRMKELVNEVDNNGNTLLHLALIHSDLEIADTLLLTSSINWRLKNKQGNSPKDLCKSDDQIPIRLKCFASAWRTKESVDMEIFYDKQVTNLDDLSNYYKSWDQCLNFQGPGENSILHIAARDGKMKIIDQSRKSKSACRMLLLGKNFKGETPLHMAAEYGHLRFVKAILSVCTQTDIFGSGRKSHQSASVIENGEANDEMEDFKPWKFKAKNGDTPVHKAMRNGHSATALFLLHLEPELASFVNKANESLLYLAADQGCFKVGKEILSTSRAYPFSISGPDGKNPLHAGAAASKRGYHIGVHLMKRRPDLLSMVDNEGKTPLHYAAEKAKPSLVSQLIKQDKSTAFVYDKEGFTPLLRAAISGSYMGIEAILEGCPLSAELRDVSNNRTVLHLIAAKSSYGLQKCLNHKNMVKLINEIDRDGNTPLHSAVLDGDKRKVIALFKAKGVNRRIRNKQHQMPMDLCEKLMGNGNEEQREIHKSFKRLETGVVSPIEWVRHWIGRVGSIPTDVKLLREEELKQLLNNLALVATLLVTLTFAALFTIPGGYDQTTGKALRMKQVAIQVFVASDAVAMLLGIAVLLGYTSAISTGYHVYLEDIASSSVTMLQYSLRATVLAFLCGLYALVANVAIWIIVLSVVVTARVAFFPWI